MDSQKTEEREECLPGVNVAMDCSDSLKDKFSLKFKALLYIAIFYTGACALIGVANLASLIYDKKLWQETEGESINAVLWENIFYIIMILFFIALLKIAISKRPFSDLLINCFYISGIILIAGAVLLPLLPTYEMPHLISGIEGKPYIDGMPFTIGILIVILGKLIKYGYAYQKEIDETI